MYTKIEQQVAMDEALVPHAQRDMLQICLRFPGKSFAKLTFEEEIRAFIQFLGHSAAFRTLTDVNINKLYQPWRSFAAIINKGLYHKRNVDYAYLMWEDFVYQVEHKNQKTSNEMYYPRFTKVIIHHFLSKYPSILRRNKVNWHYVRDDYMNSKAYKEYYAIAIGEAAPKPKASVMRARSSFDTFITPPTAAASPRLAAAAKGKQTAKASKAKSLSSLSEEVEKDDKKDDVEESRNDEEGGDDDQGYDDEASDEEAREEESFDLIPQTLENSKDEGDGEEDLGLNVGEEERHIEEEEEDELYRDVNINRGRGIQETLEVEDYHVTLTPVNPDGMESIFETASTSVAPLPITTPTMTPSTIATITATSQAPILPTTAPSSIIQDLPNFRSLFGFDSRLKSLEANFSKFWQTNPFAKAVSAIPGIVHRYMDQHINEVVKVAVQIHTDRLCDVTQRESDEFLRSIDENMKKIIKEQVKNQVKVQVPKILPGIEQAVNEQLEAEVLTRSSHSSRTSYVVAADLSEMELKKIIIKKMEGNKSIQRSDEQRNLYKALVEGYEADKIILDTYGETVTLKRRRDDDVDKDEGPFVGPHRGSKRRREGKEPESASAPSKTATRSVGSLVELEYHLEEVFKATTDQLDWVNPEGQQYPHNLLQPLPLIPNNRGHRVIPFEHFINNDLEYLRGESARDVYSKRRSIAVTQLKIVEWHSYKHLDWITIQRDDDNLYKFKEGDFKRLRIQDIKDMLLLLLQGKLTNLTVKKRFAFNVSLWMFTRSIVIHRRVKDLQLGVESYQKRLNLTKPDTYRSDLKRKEAYTAYSNP
nr:hypothetical protein [Tanacetum cinerariifolium]